MKPGMRALFDDFERCERFTKEEEHALYRSWKYGGNDEARERLIMSVAPWASKVADGLKGQGIPADELVAEALFQLVKKFRLWNPKRGRLTTFVSVVIFRALIRKLRCNRYVISVPDRARSKHKVSDDLEQKRENIVRGVFSLSMSEKPEDFLASASVAGSSCDEEIDEIKDWQKRILHRSIKYLNYRTQAVIAGRIAGKTYDQIGAELGVTKERIRQIVVNAVQKIQWMAQRKESQWKQMKV